MMEAFSRNLRFIFEMQRQYFVPLYQRPYVWERDKQWAPLWEDVAAIAENRLKKTGDDVRPHFLGAVVLDQLRVPTGEVERRLVIDGQQRLTTIQLLLAAGRDYAASRNLDNIASAFDQMATNTDPLLEKAQSKFKVVPTNVDRDEFEQVMTARSLGEALRRFDRLNLTGEASFTGIAGCYKYFTESIDAWASEPGQTMELRIRALLGALRDDLQMVLIDLGDKDDAQIIFETLNARGTPLLPSDLIKNYLFLKLEDEGNNPDELYGLYWRRFDQNKGFWRKVVKQGRLNRPRMDIFLQDYMVMNVHQDVQAEGLFSRFKGWSSSSGLSTKDALMSISSYGESYDAFYGFQRGTPRAQFVDRLQAMEQTTPMPLLLYLFEKERRGSVDVNLDRILIDIESYLVRRMICRLTTKNYNKFFIDILAGVNKGTETSAADVVRKYLREAEGESVRWPSDEEFRSAWLEKPAYELLTRGRIRMILGAIEKASWSGRDDPVSLPEALTIEHILPQDWIAHWPLNSGHDQPGMGDDSLATKRGVLLHSFGNLTLLTKRLNPSVSNESWAQKREAFKQHCAYRLTRDIVDLENWDEDSILARGQRMFDVAMRIWPRP